MGTHKRLKFKLDEYLLKDIERKFKERFGEVRFRDDVARINTAQIALNRPVAPRRAAQVSAPQRRRQRAVIGVAQAAKPFSAETARVMTMLRRVARVKR